MPNLAEISGLRAELLVAYKRIETLEKELATLRAWGAEKKRYAVARPTPSMTSDIKAYPRAEAIKIEAAISRRLRYLADSCPMQLDWEVIFFAGNLAPPKRGENWTFTFSSAGKKQTVTLTEAQLVEFNDGRPGVVDEEILTALRKLR